MHKQSRHRRDTTLAAMVINQAVPRVRSRLDARVAILHTAEFLREVGRSYDVDLVVLPEHGMHGAPRRAGRHEPFTTSDEVLDALGPVCRESGLWVAVPVSAGGTRDDPDRQMALIDDNGEVVARHGADPCSRRRAAGTRTVVGPGGLRTALAYGDSVRPFLSDDELWGAELVVQYWASPAMSPRRVVQAARSLAWTNTCFVVSANAAGTDGSHHWTGHSSLVSYDGAVLGLCGDLEYELQYAELPIAALRAERLRQACSSRSAADTFAARSRRSPSLHPAPTKNADRAPIASTSYGARVSCVRPERIR